MNDTQKPITSVTVRWSTWKESGVVSKGQREKIVAAMKAGDILVMDLMQDAIAELTSIYNEGLNHE
jgi:hypothetical protein